MSKFALEFFSYEEAEMAARKSASIVPFRCKPFDAVRRALVRYFGEKIGPPREFGGSAYHVELVSDAADAPNKLKNFCSLDATSFDLMAEKSWGFIGDKAFVFFLADKPLLGNSTRPHITIAYFPGGCSEQDKRVCTTLVLDSDDPLF